MQPPTFLLLSVCVWGTVSSSPIQANRHGSHTHYQQGATVSCIPILSVNPSAQKLAKEARPPWEYKMEAHPDMCPQVVHQARCIDSYCHKHKLRSVPITTTIFVLFRRSDGTNLYRLEPGLFNLTTGCTCR